MKEDRSDSGSAQRSWIDKLGQVLRGEPRDQEELVSDLREAQHRGLLGADALSMIEGVLQVTDMQVRDIMIPRSQMVVVSRDAGTKQLIAIAIESGHSRFPVIGESRDEVVGVLLAKDLLRYASVEDDASFAIREVLRPAVFVPGSKRLNVLLKEFRTSRNHIAVVVDDYGGVAGMVTIEDVLEQIVGEIEDEYDVDEESFIRKFSDISFGVKALTPIEDFNDYFGTDFSDEEFDTIGGLVTAQLGRLPKRGETVVLDRMSFKIVRADNRRLHLMKLTLLPVADAASGGTEV
ncbi:MAG: transporter associated domain-containing protein [Gammaproteobacteria bacterium]|jgi:magnesium and cobalt transporter